MKFDGSDFSSEASDSLSDDGNKQVWCICKMPANGKFMIGCDGCDEWYHGACINITEQESQKIIKYFCSRCQKRNPTLRTIYKKSTHEKLHHRDDKDKRRLDKKKKKYDSMHRHKKSHKSREKIIPNLSDDEEEISALSSTLPQKSDNNPPASLNKEEKADISNSKKLKCPTDASNLPYVSSSSTHLSKTTDASSNKCGQCKGCKRTVDCGTCDPCLSSTKLTCRKRRCFQDRNIFNMKCQSTSERSLSSGQPSKHTFGKRVRRLSDSSDESWTPRAQNKRRKQTSGDDDKNDSVDDEEEYERSVNSKGKPRQHTRAPISRGRVQTDKMTRSSGSQCLGLDCVKPARRGSKYCSDECGIALATRRIYEFLPIRLQHWSATPCISEQRNKQQLSAVRQEIDVVHRRLIQMEEEHQKLNKLIDYTQTLTSKDEEEATEEEEQELSEQVFCVTCATEVNLRQALRHMEKCFQKVESNTVFYASYKEQLTGTPLFCDTYDSQMKAYCKRLKVLCEHTKEPKIPDNMACGYPIMRNLHESTGEYCLESKKKCTRHLGWERLRRAKIDVERYRLLVRVDELLNEEQQLRTCLTGRGGVLGLMLHQTVDHDPVNPIIPPVFKPKMQNFDKPLEILPRLITGPLKKRKVEAPSSPEPCNQSRESLSPPIVLSRPLSVSKKSD